MRDRFILRAFCVYTVIVWVVLAKNMIVNEAGHDWGFRLVHLALAAISLLFAFVVFPMAAKLRGDKDPAGMPDEQHESR